MTYQEEMDKENADFRAAHNGKPHRYSGWFNGSFYCDCGASFGTSLTGVKPFSSVSEHSKTCEHSIELMRLVTPRDNRAVKPVKASS